MKATKNRWLTLRRSNPKIVCVMIGIPQFSFTLEHRYMDIEGYWETAISILIFAIFIHWGKQV